MTDRELQHYGVLGMKWGVRKNPTKAYVKATKKQRRLDRRAKYYSNEVENIKKGLEEARQVEKERVNAKQISQAKMNIAARDLASKTARYEKSTLDPFGTKSSAVGRATKKYREAVREYEADAKDADEAIFSRGMTEETLKTYVGYAKRSMSKSKRWEAAMNTAFKDVSPDAIAAGKAILEKKKRK